MSSTEQSGWPEPDGDLSRHLADPGREPDGDVRPALGEALAAEWKGTNTNAGQNGWLERARTSMTGRVGRRTSASDHSPSDRNADSIGRLDLVLSGLLWRALYLRFDKNG